MENLLAAMQVMKSLHNPPEVIHRVISWMEIVTSPLRKWHSAVCRVDRQIVRRILGIGSSHIEGSYDEGWMRRMYFVRIPNRNTHNLMRFALDGSKNGSILVRVTKTQSGVIIDEAPARANSKFKLTIAEIGYPIEGNPFAFVYPRDKSVGHGLVFGLTSV